MTDTQTEKRNMSLERQRGLKATAAAVLFAASSLLLGGKTASGSSLNEGNTGNEPGKVTDLSNGKLPVLSAPKDSGNISVKVAQFSEMNPDGKPLTIANTISVNEIKTDTIDNNPNFTDSLIRVPAKLSEQATDQTKPVDIPFFQFGADIKAEYFPDGSGNQTFGDFIGSLMDPNHGPLTQREETIVTALLNNKDYQTIMNGYDTLLKNIASAQGKPVEEYSKLVTYAQYATGLTIGAIIVHTDPNPSSSPDKKNSVFVPAANGENEVSVPANQIAELGYLTNPDATSSVVIIFANPQNPRDMSQAEVIGFDGQNYQLLKPEVQNNQPSITSTPSFYNADLKLAGYEIPVNAVDKVLSSSELLTASSLAGIRFRLDQTWATVSPEVTPKVEIPDENRLTIFREYMLWETLKQTDPALGGTADGPAAFDAYLKRRVALQDKQNLTCKVMAMDPNSTDPRGTMETIAVPLGKITYTGSLAANTLQITSLTGGVQFEVDLATDQFYQLGPSYYEYGTTGQEIHNGIFIDPAKPDTIIMVISLYPQFIGRENGKLDPYFFNNQLTNPFFDMALPIDLQKQILNGTAGNLSTLPQTDVGKAPFVYPYRNLVTKYDPRTKRFLPDGSLLKITPKSAQTTASDNIPNLSDAHTVFNPISRTRRNSPQKLSL